MFKTLCASGLRWTWIALLVLIVDRISKLWVADALIPYYQFYVLPIFNLTLAFNRGAAFSFLSKGSGWQNLLLGGIAIIASVFIIFWLKRQSYREKWTNIALALILGGALGNLWDRLSYAYVIDFLDFHLESWHFAVFNFADSAICIGAFMLLFHWLFMAKS